MSFPVNVATEVTAAGNDSAGQGRVTHRARLEPLLLQDPSRSLIPVILLGKVGMLGWIWLLLLRSRAGPEKRDGKVGEQEREGLKGCTAASPGPSEGRKTGGKAASR